MRLPELYTERLRLRMPRSSDLDHIYALGNDPEVMRYITYGRTQTYSEAKADLRRRIRQSGNGLGYWITEILETRDFVGWMALKPLDNTEHIEIGYRFLREHWNKGYATEAGEKLLHFAFNNLELSRVVSVALADNQASTRVMEKLGLRFDHHGRYYDTECVFYQITYQEWKSMHASEQSNSEW